MNAMTITTFEAPPRPDRVRRPTAGAQPATRRRPGRGSGRRARPQARPARPIAAPSLAPLRRPSSGSCAGPPLPAAWRVTERGLGVIMIAGLMIVAAAVAVISLTAFQVTSETYHAYGSVATPQQ